MQKSLIKFPRINQLVEHYSPNMQELRQATLSRYLFIVDVSGSMYHDIPVLREDMKNNIANTLQKGDILSLIYYSSNGDYGFILKDYNFNGLDALKSAQNSIDLLECRNMTGFCDPLNLAASYLKEKKDGHSNVVVFMSDGYENQNAKEKVIEATENLAAQIDAGIVVEYGNYANHELLVQMSDILGSFSVANDIHDYRCSMENVLKNNYSNKYTLLPHESDMEEVFSFDASGQITRYQQKNGSYAIPDGIGAWVLRSKESGGYTANATEREYLQVLLALVYIKQLKNESMWVWKYLGEIGSVALIDLYNKSIGKQRVNEFLNVVQTHIVNTIGLFNKGKDLSYLPDEKAYCIFDFIKDFQAGDNKVFTRHKAFDYKKIGSKKEQATAVLTAEDKARLANAASIEEVKSLIEGKYKIKYEFSDHDIGANLDSLVWNSSRANLSFSVYHPVSVDLRQIPEFNSLYPNASPQVYDFHTHIFRSYAIISDGILNIERLPCSLDYNTFKKFHEQGLIEEDYKDGCYLVNISTVPVVNRAMLRNINVKNFIEMNYLSLKLGGGQKVYNSLVKEIFPLSRGEGFVDKFGEEFTGKLKEWGITEHNGFNPPTVSLSGSDAYYAPTVEVKIKGISSLPTLNAVAEKILNGKPLTPREELMGKYYRDYQDFVKSIEDKEEEIQENLLKDYLEYQQNLIRARKREIDEEISKVIFSAFLSKFNFENALENGSFIVEDGEDKLVATVEQKEIEIKL